MIRPIRRGLDIGQAFVLGSILVLLPGCGSSTPKFVPDNKTPEQRVQESSLAQVGDVIRLFTEEKGSPPATADDLLKYERAFPSGCGKLKSGEIVLIYGVPLQDGGSDQVLAYEKQTPDSGGYVLMQDGKTVKKLTADEFKSAPKPGKG